MLKENQTYLALDPATRFGYALWQPGMPNPVYGAWKFEFGKNGEKWIGLQNKLERLRRDWNGLRAIRMEFNTNVHMGERATDLGYGWKHAAEGFTAAYRIPFATVTTDGGWRIDFIGRQEKTIINQAARAAKAQGVKFDSRDKLKLATIGRCQQLGWSPKCDNEADALGLLDSWLTELRIETPWKMAEVLRPPLGRV